MVGNGDAMVLKPTPVTRLRPPQTPPADSLVTKTGATNGFGAYVAFILAARSGLCCWRTENNPTAVRLALAKQIFAALNIQGIPAQ